MIIGVDFDNTIVSYDQLFHRVSVEQKLIDETFDVNKIKIRNYLRSINKENIWTEMQGYVYGFRMQEAAIFPLFKKFFLKTIENGHKIVIISHKTKFGHFDDEKNLLREIALEFLKNNKIIDCESILVNDVFFLNTRKEKIEKIVSEKVEIFIDDLIEVIYDLKKFSQIKTIHFPKFAYRIKCTDYF